MGKWFSATHTIAGSWTAITDGAVSLAIGAPAPWRLPTSSWSTATPVGSPLRQQLLRRRHPEVDEQRHQPGATSRATTSRESQCRGLSSIPSERRSRLHGRLLRGRSSRLARPPACSLAASASRGRTSAHVSWTLLEEVPEANGATDVEIDPQNADDPPWLVLGPIPMPQSTNSSATGNRS